jgi:hypothetical protein
MCHRLIAGKHVLGTREATGKIYEMSLDYYDEAGTAIQRIRRAPHLSSNGSRVSYSRFILDAEMGVGNVNDPTPSVTLTWSDDGGKNFTAGLTRTLGASGATKNRTVWHRLGRIRDRVFQITTTAKAKIAFIDAYLDLS